MFLDLLSLIVFREGDDYGMCCPVALITDVSKEHIAVIIRVKNKELVSAYSQCASVARYCWRCS
jgi:hypothetical protein